jgi:uncharacterized protein YndB with AHSA1/START domain
MAGFSHTVDIPRTPADVFPWLFDEDKVPRWTGALESYRVEGGAVRAGSRVRQVLQVGDRRIDVDMEVTRHEPPHSAETRFATNGIDVVNAYRLEAAGAGTRLSQSLEANPTSFKARLLIPVLQPRLERKLTEDLERLRGLLSED